MKKVLIKSLSKVIKKGFDINILNQVKIIADDIKDYSEDNLIANIINFKIKHLYKAITNHNLTKIYKQEELIKIISLILDNEELGLIKI